VDPGWNIVVPREQQPGTVPADCPRTPKKRTETMKTLLPISTDAQRTAFEEAAFAAWMVRVDALLVRKVGLDSRDLPDICYRELHDDGASPAEAASAALRAAREDA
jgi:hypothetical protein